MLRRDDSRAGVSPPSPVLTSEIEVLSSFHDVVSGHLRPSKSSAFL